MCCGQLGTVLPESEGGVDDYGPCSVLYSWLNYLINIYICDTTMKYNGREFLAHSGQRPAYPDRWRAGLDSWTK
jgi:hypothetical protein